MQYGYEETMVTLAVIAIGFTPLDVIADGADVVKNLATGNLSGAALSAGAMFLPEIAEQGIKQGKKLLNSSEGVVDAVRPLLKTEPNSAFFWSGRYVNEAGDVVGVMDDAARIAKSKGGNTLETLIDAKGIQMPEWDIDNPASIKAWEDVSAAYANQVSGDVRGVIGSQLREGNIWENVELPRLKANSNVTKINTIDPVKMIETTIFER